VGLVQAMPVAAVNEDLDGSARPRGGEHVEPLARHGAVWLVEPPVQRAARHLALARVPAKDLDRLRHLAAVVVLAIERLAIVTTEYGGPHAAKDTTARRSIVAHWTRRRVMIGFIGLGVMGESMCRNLAKKSGEQIVAFDTRAEPLAALARD